MGAVIVIAGVILMVVIHEGAHFLAAKAFNIKATEAFFGFGPRLWSMKKGETEYEEMRGQKSEETKDK